MTDTQTCNGPVQDAKQFAKLRRNADWANPNKFETFDADKSREISATGDRVFVFQNCNTSRIVKKLHGTETWGVIREPTGGGGY